MHHRPPGWEDDTEPPVWAQILSAGNGVVSPLLRRFQGLRPVSPSVRVSGMKFRIVVAIPACVYVTWAPSSIAAFETQASAAAREMCISVAGASLDCREVGHGPAIIA